MIVTAALASAFLWRHNLLAALLMAMIAATAAPARQILMPAINLVTDRGQRSRFKWLHALSVVITLAHMGAAGYVLLSLV